MFGLSCARSTTARAASTTTVAPTARTCCPCGRRGSTWTTSSRIWTRPGITCRASVRSGRSRYTSRILPKEEGKEAAIAWNEAMAEQVRLFPGRFWASAAIPFVDAATAVRRCPDDAVLRLGLKGANVPGSVGDDPFIDAPRLEPFVAARNNSACRSFCTDRRAVRRRAGRLRRRAAPHAGPRRRSERRRVAADFLRHHGPLSGSAKW